MELISYAVELHGDPIEDNTHEVYFKDGIFTAKSNYDGSERKFKLLKTIEEMTKEEKEAVHHYCTGKWYGQISLKDVFLHNVHIEEIK